MFAYFNFMGRSSSFVFHVVEFSLVFKFFMGLNCSLSHKVEIIERYKKRQNYALEHANEQFGQCFRIVRLKRVPQSWSKQTFPMPQVRVQSSFLKHVEKFDQGNLNGENVDSQMTTLMLNCTILAFFEHSLISNLWDRLCMQMSQMST